MLDLKRLPSAYFLGSKLKF